MKEADTKDDVSKDAVTEEVVDDLEARTVETPINASASASADELEMIDSTNEPVVGNETEESTVEKAKLKKLLVLI